MTEPDHPIELELKYRAVDSAPLRALAGMETLGPARLGAPVTSDEVDRYLDTADRRLAAARWACRLRTRSGRSIVSLKGPARHEAADALHRRAELEGPATAIPDPAGWPPSAARDLLLRMAGGGTLVERFTLAQQRTERDVLVEGRTVGQLSLDACSVLRGGEPRGELLMVELELADDALAEALDAALAAVPGLLADPHTKLEHALALLGELADP